MGHGAVAKALFDQNLRSKSMQNTGLIAIYEADILRGRSSVLPLACSQGVRVTALPHLLHSPLCGCVLYVLVDRFRPFLWRSLGFDHHGGWSRMPDLKSRLGSSHNNNNNNSAVAMILECG